MPPVIAYEAGSCTFFVAVGVQNCTCWSIWFRNGLSSSPTSSGLLLGCSLKLSQVVAIYPEASCVFLKFDFHLGAAADDRNDLQRSILRSHLSSLRTGFHGCFAICTAWCLVSALEFAFHTDFNPCTSLVDEGLCCPGPSPRLPDSSGRCSYRITLKKSRSCQDSRDVRSAFLHECSIQITKSNINTHTLIFCGKGRLGCDAHHSYPHFCLLAHRKLRAAVLFIV